MRIPPRLLPGLAALVLATAAAPSAIAAPSTAPQPPPQAAAVADNAAGTFVPVTPTRVLDTRTGLGAAAAKVSAHTALRVQVGGVAGVPETGVAAVVLNVTVPAPARKGYVTVYPASDHRPVASNLNVAAGETRAGLAVAKLGLNGGVAIYNGTGAASHLVADVSGYYLDGGGSDPGTFVPLSPSRVLDTRNGTGAPRGDVAARGSVELVIAGHGGVPATGVAAVALGVTDVRPEHGGYVTAYPTGGDRPGTSTLNAPAGHTVANLAIVPLGDGGTVTLHNGSTGTTNLVADVFGYVLEGETIARGGYVPVAPTRILDTRRPTVAAGGVVPPRGEVTVQVTGVAPVPDAPVEAVVVNLTATRSTSSGYVTAYAAERRVVSALNFRAGRTVANLAVVPLDRLTGSFRLYNGSRGETHLVADIAGYVLGPQPSTLTWTDEGIVHPTGGSNLRSVSCPSADFCAAVDSVGKVVFFDGSDWSWPTDSDKADAVGMDRTIACSAADRCVVVDSLGRMAVFDGTTWTTPAHLSPTGTPLTQAACAPGGRCIAIDADDNAYVLNDSTWSAALPVGLTGITDLACPADDACIAVAYDGTVAQYDGVGWSAPAPISGLSEATSISCPSPAFCAIIGASLFTSTDRVSWTQGPDAPAGVASGDLACTGPDACTLIDGPSSTMWDLDGDAWAMYDANDVIAHGSTISPTDIACAGVDLCALAASGGMVTVRRGGEWSNAEPIDGFHTVVDVSCPGAEDCVGVDGDGYVFERRDDAWEAPIHLPGGTPTALDCPTDTFCMMATSTQPVVFDGTSGRIVSGPQSVAVLSCASPDFCAAVTSAGAAWTYDGSSWTLDTTRSYAGSAGASGLDCPSPDFCAVAFDDGRTATMEDGVWGQAAPVADGTRLSAVACGSDRFCLAGDAAGRVLTYDGEAWGSTPVQVDPKGRAIYGLSCPNEEMCVASSYAGTWVYSWNSWASDPSTETGGRIIDCPDPASCIVLGRTGWATVGRSDALH